MPFDTHKNLAAALVVTAPTPAISGTSLTVMAGRGALFSVPPFNATVHLAAVSVVDLPTQAEIVRVTGIAGDVLTLLRAQEGTAARAIVAGDAISETPTAKAFTDIESGQNFPSISTGAITATGRIFGNDPGGLVFDATAATTNQNYLRITNTSGSAYFGVENSAASAFGANAYAAVVYTATAPGLTLMAVNAAGAIRFQTGGAVVRGLMHASGGFSWGSTVDPGAGNLTVAGTGGNVACKDQPNAYTRRQIFKGGPGDTPSTYYGLEIRGSDIIGGDHAAAIWNATNQAVGAKKWRIINYLTRLYFETLTDAEDNATSVLVCHRSGGVSVGTDVTDPGANNLRVTGTLTTVGAGNFTGWVPGGAAPAGVQVGVSGPYCYVHAYSYSSSTYQPMRVVGSTVELVIGGTSYLKVEASGAITIPSSINGQTISAAASLTGSLYVYGHTIMFGGSGVAYHNSPIEVQYANHPRISFHWPGVVASQIGMDSAGTIRCYDNPGTGYANITAGAFVVASDQRLKRDRGVVQTTDVLARLVVHDYEVIATGEQTRGVFAQEVLAVLPSVVLKGTDDDHGNLINPWSVDYSKFVPDLIVGWQQHEARLAALEEQLYGRTRPD
jgi:hypothetical protein